MTRFQILYWQDVPSLVKVFAADGSAVSHQLPDWFQQEIDRRAMDQGLIGSDAYLQHWEWRDTQPREGSLHDALDAVETELTKP